MMWFTMKEWLNSLAKTALRGLGFLALAAGFAVGFTINPVVTGVVLSFSVFSLVLSYAINVRNVRHAQAAAAKEEAELFSEFPICDSTDNRVSERLARKEANRFLNVGILSDKEIAINDAAKEAKAARTANAKPTYANAVKNTIRSFSTSVKAVVEKVADTTSDWQVVSYRRKK